MNNVQTFIVKIERDFVTAKANLNFYLHEEKEKATAKVKANLYSQPGI